ncbi:hypothetical protein LUS53_25960 [Escherichia coli]|uniref:hypothetical protein n=1 Tax=Enterobacteriaceae TaxID=543 RepID=UPI001E4460F0|nr:hypothetical protein [Escherichia coli]MCD9370887.1 hypothetical protein [Escherichia coli]MCD9390348.1 hypothetical protein [Escherichia coli]
MKTKYTRAKELENKTFDEIFKSINNFEINDLEVIYYALDYNENLTKEQIKDLIYEWCTMHL